MKKFLLAFSVLALALVATTFIHAPKAAAFYTTYCDVLADPSSPGSGTDANCGNGQQNNGLTNLNGYSGAALKAKFISDINNYASSGYGFQQIGAHYIENHLEQNGGDWEDNLNQSNVTFALGNIPSQYQCVNTAYHTTENQVVSTGDCADTLRSVLIYQNGNLVFIVKLDCGNPIGNLGGPQQASTNHAPSGNLSVSCTLNSSNQDVYKFTYTFADADGNSGDHAAAYLSSGLYAVDDTSHALAGSYDSAGAPYTGDTTSASYTGAWPGTVSGGYHDVWLHVRDVTTGSDTWTNQDHVSTPTCPNAPTPSHLPTGTQTVTCNSSGTAATINYSFGDSDYPTGGTYAFTLIRASSSEPGGGSTARNPFDSATMVAGATGNPDWVKFGSGTSGSRTTSVVNGSYSTWLYVKDIDSSNNGDTYYLKGEQRITCSGGTTSACSATISVSPHGPPSGQSVTDIKLHQQSAAGPTDDAHTVDTGLTHAGSVNVSSYFSYNGQSLPFVVYTLYSGGGHDYYGPVYVTASCGGGGGGGSTPPPSPPTSCSASITVSANSPPGGQYVTDIKLHQQSAAGPTDAAHTVDTGLTSGGTVDVSSFFSYSGQSLPFVVYTLYSGGGHDYYGPVYITDSCGGGGGGGGGGTPEDGYGSATAYATCTDGSITVHGTAHSANNFVTLYHSSTDQSVFWLTYLSGGEDGTFTIPGSTVAFYAASGTFPTLDSYIQTNSITTMLVRAYGAIPGGAIDGYAAVSIPPCAPVTPISFKPYLKVYGGDVEAGYGPSASSTCVDNTARLESWNNDDAAASGAGTQFGAQALSVIQGFASAQGNTSGNPPPGSGLSFANNPTPSGDTFGGSFNDAQSCRDYSSGLSGAQTSDYNPGGIVTVTNGTHTTVYVTGHNAYLSGNVLYSGSGSYTSLANIPSYKLVVVGGNIYIGSGVTELDGLYVAQPNAGGTGGNIYTCASGPGAAVSTSDANFYTTCHNKLTVYGSFIAKHVEFLRTSGDVPQAASTPDTLAANGAAETFVYSPEEWLGQSGVQLTGQPDAITSLPPVL